MPAKPRKCDRTRSRKKDAWGIPALRITCAWRENERALLQDMCVAAAEMLTAAGAKNITPFVENNAPGLTIHEMGTARMGRDPKTSVLKLTIRHMMRRTSL